MSHFWQRVLIAAVMIVIAAGLAKVVDWRIARRRLPVTAVTRYRVLRRAVFTAIVFVGVLSALLVIPQVRAVAGGVLASSAVVGLVIGFASQRTIGNVAAGILIALSQPVRLGDEVEVEGARGIVEEIGLTYTWIRTPDNERLVVPNEKLASETIRNATIRRSKSLVEVTLTVPASTEMRRVLDVLQESGDEAYLRDLGDRATFVVRRWVPREQGLEAAASDLRVELAERLRAAEVVET